MKCDEAINIVNKLSKIKMIDIHMIICVIFLFSLLFSIVVDKVSVNRTLLEPFAIRTPFLLNFTINPVVFWDF